MNELIPAGDGMPAASEAGGVDYLERLAAEDQQVAKELVLEALSFPTSASVKARMELR